MHNYGQKKKGDSPFLADRRQKIVLGKLLFHKRVFHDASRASLTEVRNRKGLRAVYSSPQFRHCIITWWSLISYECITISSLLLNSDISPQFWHLVKPLKNGQFWRPKKWMWGLQKKVIPRIHIGMAFLQKTGSKLVKFGPCGPTYILPGHIGGRHPVPCLSTQIAERQGTAMYYVITGSQTVSYAQECNLKKLPEFSLRINLSLVIGCF